jgi:branched-chain amino acid transport system substrate-binding protein
MTAMRRALIVLAGISLAAHLGLVSVVLAQEKTEIVIGASIPLTGGVAAHGRDLKWAYELAASTFNADGGIFVKDYGKKLKVKLVTADNGSNPMKAASTVEKLINVDKVDMLLGGAEPTCVLAACQVAERYKKFYHTAFGFPAPAWLEKKFKWSTDFFFAMEQGCAVPFEVLNSIDKEKRPKRLALIMEDSFTGKGLASVLREAGKKRGYEPVLELALPIGASDYTAQITKMKEAGVDGILVYASVQDLETFVRQLKKNNLNVPYIHTWKGGWSGMFWKNLGKDAQYIITNDVFWSMDYPFKGAKELGEKYYQTFNEYSITVGLPYALAQILFQAIEKAGSLDGEKVRNAVLSNTFDTVMGPVKYDQTGLAIFSTNAAQWWDGRQMLLYPSKYATWGLKLAPPWDQR